MAESVEKLEDGIVRSAEQVSSQIRAAKEAIASVIFGQDPSVNALSTAFVAGLPMSTTAESSAGR